METSNLPDADIKTLVTRMLNELRGRLQALGENFKKEMESIKQYQSEIMNKITEIKNTLLAVNNRLDEAEDCIRDLIENRKSEQ